MSEPHHERAGDSDEALPNKLTLRDRFFIAWARAVTARPLAVLLVCTLLAAGAVVYTVRNLEFRSDRSELVDPSLDFQRRYAEFRARFPRWDDAVVVVDTASAKSPAVAEAFLAALEARLRADERFSAVTAGFTSDEAPTSLILTEPLERIQSHVAQMKRATVVVTSPNLDNLLRFSLLGGSNLDAAQREQITALLGRAADAAAGKRGDVLGLDQGMHRLIRPGGTLATVLVALRDKSTDAERIESIKALREHIRELREGPVRTRAANDPMISRIPGPFESIRAGVTGIPVLEADETAQSTRDGERAGIVSLFGIVALMLVAYRGVVVPLLATFTLLIGVAWAFAFATLAVGHLQLLSITFATMLMGLGIDVAIHLIARLELVHPSHGDLGDAIERVFRTVGPGIVTATITIAAGAGAMALTPFSGVAEMGIIAAGGIILCTVAIMSALPAALMLLRNPSRHLLTHEGGESRPFLGSFGRLLYVRPKATILAACVIAAASVWLARGVVYDTDLQNLMPTGSESVEWQQRLERDDQQSVWHAVVLAKDAAEARDLTLRLRELPEVGDVGGAGMLFQSDASLAAKRAVLETLPDEHFYRAALDTLPEANVSTLRSVCDSLAKTFEKNDAALAAAARSLSALNDASLLRAMEMYQQDREKLASTLMDLRGVLPLPAERLPDALKDTMVAPDGSLLLRIYPKETAGGVLSPARLEPFAKAALAAVPEATGPSIQIYESTRLITGAYRDAAMYALIAIAIILLIDFRNIGDALVALLPVLLGAAMMLAVMRLANMALNLANLIVMPLIVGIGVGCGVHAVRRWRLQPNDPPPGLAGGSGRAITLTTLTTILGFAALLVGEHRGIKSLGIVMTLGLALVWVVTVFVLPGVLAVRSKP